MARRNCCVCDTRTNRFPIRCSYPDCNKIICNNARCYSEHYGTHTVDCWFCGKECDWGLNTCKEKGCDVPLHEHCTYYHLYRDHLSPRLDAIETQLSTKLDTILDLLGFEPTQEKAKQLKDHFESIAKKELSATP